MTKLDAALDAVRRGFAVFPLVPNAKTPAIERWQYAATRDEARIVKWWTADPDYNIGGLCDGKIVLDVDPRNGGAGSFNQLALIEDFPKTARAKTQGGGHHIIYRTPDRVSVSKSKGRFGPGIDVQASAGAYIVLPGSTIDGRPYQWGNDRPIAEAPAWMVDRAKTRVTKSSAAGKRLVEEDDDAVQLAETWLKDHAPEAFEGARDDTAFKVAAKLYDFGVSKATALDLLHEWNETLCQPPLDIESIERLADSGGRHRSKPIGVMHPDNASGFEAVDVSRETRDNKSQEQSELIAFDEAVEIALVMTNEPLVDGVIDRGTFSTWYGPPKSGKTFIVLGLAFAIALGLAWAGKKTRQGAVLYVAGEGGRGILKRLAALKKRHPEARDVPLFLLRKPIDLLHGKLGVETIVAKCREIEKRTGLKVDLIVIDTIARALSGGDENSPSDMGALVKNLDAIRAVTGAHMLGIHHTGKDAAKGARGHSSLLGAVDTEMRILNGEISASAQRDLDDDFAMRFSLDTVNIGEKDGKHVSSCVVNFSKCTKRPDTRIDLDRDEQDQYAKILAVTGGAIHPNRTGLAVENRWP
jgi:hypothetical protein